MYSITEKEGKIVEIKALGHIDRFEFWQRCKTEYGVDFELDQVRQIWECMRVIKNVISFQECSKHCWGANPVTVVKLCK